MGGICPTYHLRRSYPLIPQTTSARSTRRKACALTYERRARVGWASASTSATRSTFCIRSRLNGGRPCLRAILDDYFEVIEPGDETDDRHAHVSRRLATPPR